MKARNFSKTTIGMYIRLIHTMFKETIDEGVISREKIIRLESGNTAYRPHYPRLGYVAFSRAERYLCIACLEKVSDAPISKLKQLGVII